MPGRPRKGIWIAVWALAMAAGVVAAALGWVASRGYEQRLLALGREAAALKRELEGQQAFVGLLRDPTTRVVALAGAGPSPGARGRMMWHAGAGGLLVATGLPAIPPDKAYQLWAITGKNPPVPAGTFTVDARGMGSLRVPPLAGAGRVDVFVVTLEPAGGRPAPSGPMYLAGKS